MHPDRMPSLSLGIIVVPGAVYDSHHQWHSSDGVLNASVRFEAGGYSSAHIQGQPAALRELAAALVDAADLADPPAAPAPAPAVVEGVAGWWATTLPEEGGCPACASGWHARCCWPDRAEDGDGELVERCCDGLLIARRRRPLWTR